MERDTQYVKGIDQVLNRLNQEISGVEGRTTAGLLAFGFVVQRGAQERTPREYGTLVSSAFTRKTPENEMVVEVGYGGAAGAYAAAVHEKTAMKLRGKPRRSGIGVYWGPSGEARFLANSVIENAAKGVPIVQSYARVGGRGGKR